MADFTLAQIGGPQTGAPSGGGQQSVQQPQPSAAGAALNLFSQVMPTAQQFQQRAQQKQERERAGAVEQFSQQQLALAESVDMGLISSQEARMRMRANYSRAIANNPLLTDDYASAQDQIIGTSGLGKVAAEGTEEEQRHKKLVREAASAGWVQSHMSAAEADQMTQNWQRFNQAKDDLSMRQAKLTYRRGQVGLQSDVQSLETGRINQQRARIGLQNDKDARQAKMDLGIMADAYYPKFRSDIEEIQRRVEEGELTQQQGIVELETAMADISQVVGAAGADAGGDYIANMTAGFTRTRDLAERVIMGELDKDVYETQLARNIAAMQLTATGDDQIAAAVAMSRLFDGALPESILGTHTARAVTGAIDRLTNEGGPVPDPTDRDAGAAFSLLKENMGESARGNPALGEDHTRQVELAVNRILEGLDAYRSAVDSPEKLNEAAEFIASEEFRQYISMPGVRINAQAAQAGHEMFMQSYHQEITPLIEDAWREANVQTRGERFGPGPGGADSGRDPVTDHIQPTFTGGGLSFRTTSDNPRVQSRVRKLNEEVSPVVNRLIRVGAHLERHDNYEKVYKQLYENLFQMEEGEEGE